MDVDLAEVAAEIDQRLGRQVLAAKQQDAVRVEGVEYGAEGRRIDGARGVDTADLDPECVGQRPCLNRSCHDWPF